jgi:hypothetical protein
VNTEFLKAWVEALRSGRFEQGRGQLRYYSGYGAWKHCCLGVACEVGVEMDVVETHNDSFHFMLDENEGWETAILPPGFAKWIGFEERDPYIGGGKGTLTNMNDVMNLSFAEIADVIEQTWLKVEQP